jgi:ribonuclease HI
MWIAVELGVKCLHVYGDSALVINQLNKDRDMTSDKMDVYCKKSESWKVNSIASSTHMWSKTKNKQPMSCLS